MTSPELSQIVYQNLMVLKARLEDQGYNVNTDGWHDYQINTCKAVIPHPEFNPLNQRKEIIPHPDFSPSMTADLLPIPAVFKQID